ncbi:Uncharacterised protein [Helicobacter fennelliae]|uniref:Uncharacterized protein n=1 Tax=Helicobacter fennelliae TaxID=215 RepID=A0A2X3BG65_9HELI|nr:hypothetical protein [Helicobacter fennelliae]SQB98764.1 Uncharacterised protein [Helicobacter fennelliae]
MHSTTEESRIQPTHHCEDDRTKQSSKNKQVDCHSPKGLYDDNTDKVDCHAGKSTRNDEAKRADSRNDKSTRHSERSEESTNNNKSMDCHENSCEFSRNDDLDSRLKALVFDYDAKTLSAQDKASLLKALSQLKIIDPACGSGAFPMGILQEILHL